MSSFASDDRGMTGPYTDLPAVGVVAIGILLFGYLLFSAYSAYATKAHYADLKEDLRTIAIAMAGDTAIACDGRSYVLDAHKLANLSLTPDFLHRYGRPGDSVSIEVVADGFRWARGTARDISESYRLPVSVWLNDARCVSGELIVSASEGGR